MAEKQAERETPAEIAEDAVIRRLFSRSRVWVLLVALLGHIALGPLIEHAPMLEVIVDVGMIMACVFTAADTRKHLIWALALGGPAIVFFILAKIYTAPPLAWTAYFLALLLYLLVIKLFIGKIFKDKVVTLDTIGMALCTYILLGALWMMMYIPVYSLNPDSFAFNVPPDGNLADTTTFTYFSYVTLTTLGYGDISPVSPTARALAILEALTGTLFLAVLISRLVGTYSSQHSK